MLIEVSLKVCSAKMAFKHCSQIDRIRSFYQTIGFATGTVERCSPAGALDSSLACVHSFQTWIPHSVEFLVVVGIAPARRTIFARRTQAQQNA